MTHRESTKPALLAAAVVVFVLGGASSAECRSRLIGARAERRGAVLELHFAVKGKPRWHLNRHRDQLWIDLDRTTSELPPRPLFGSESPPLKLVRAEATDGGARLSLEVSGRTDYAIAMLPDELVIRLARADAVPNLAAPVLVRRGASRQPSADAVSADRDAVAARTSEPDGAPGEAAFSRVKIEVPPALGLGRAQVVVDPGHGGADPGTISEDGIREKDLALQISLRLAHALERGGVRVRLTREGDYFLPLPERTRIANRAGADLFVSIHLNSSPNADTTGIEAYYLNNTTDRATIRLARMENDVGNAYGTPAGPNLNYILSDLRQEYKATESSALARMINAQAVAELRSSFGDTRGLGAKQGPFYVLVGAHMPAVLVECGFLSNLREAHRLTLPEYQQELAEGIAGAVIHHLKADAAVGNL